MPANVDYYSSPYQDWLASYRAGGTYQPGGQRYIGGSQASPTGGYTYTPGMSNSEFVRANVRQDMLTGRGPAALGATGAPSGLIAAGVRAGQGYRTYKKAREAERREQEGWATITKDWQARAPTEYLNTLDPSSRTYQMARQQLARGPDSAMSIDELQDSLRREDADARRTQMENTISGYFNDPARAGWQRGIVENRLQNDLANVNESFISSNRQAVLGAAARGLKGGSVDVENRANVARARDTSALQAGQQADAALANFRSRDQQAEAQLRGLVNSQGIGDADQLRSALQGINAATTQEGQNYALNQQRRQLDQFGRQQQSQAWGQGLQGLANYVNTNPYWNQWGSSTTQGGW